MNRATIAIIGVLLASAGALSALGSTGAQAPSPPGHPACLPTDVVDNDDIRIWFQGAKAQLQLYKKNDTSEGNDGMYQYKSLAIEEVEDGEALATMKLENANPQNSQCTVEEEGDWVNVTYTATERVKAPGDGFLDETATFEFVYHFNESDDSAKFDLNVQEWPWQSDDSELSYDFEVTSDWVIEPAENGLGFEDEDTGEPEAFIEWAPNATAIYEDESEEEAIVDANTTGSDHHTTTTLRFTNVTAGYVELDYDPTVAVGPYVIVADVLIPLTELPEPVQRLVTQLV